VGAGSFIPYLGEANIGGLLAEALTADVEAVLADQTGTVGADAAVIFSKFRRLAFLVPLLSPLLLSSSQVDIRG
jgi:hypothetical protein